MILMKHIFNLLILPIILKRDIVISEEFFIGIFVNYLWLYKRKIIDRKTLNIIWELIARLSYYDLKHTIVLYAPPDIVKERQTKRGVRIERREQYLRLQYIVFNNVGRIFNFINTLRVRKVIADKDIISTFIEVVNDDMLLVDL